jgi:hypothetical protein
MTKVTTKFGNFVVATDGTIYQIAPYPKSLGKEVTGKTAQEVAELIRAQLK